MVITGMYSLIGLVVGSILGILLAALAARWRAMDQMSAPVVAALAVVPIVALAPVLNSMFGADSQFGAGDYTASLQTLAALRAPVDAFFDGVMVNADELDLRLNRQGLLKSLHEAMNRVADLSRLAA